MIKITNDEKLLLWATLCNDHEDQFKLAFRIYRNLFTIVPEAKNIFSPSMHPSSPEVKSNPTFQRMALHLVRVLWLAATHVETLERQSVMLKDIGKMHVKYVQRGMKQIHWVAMESALVLALKNHSYECSSLTTDQQKRTAAKIWKKIINYLIEQCRQGFMENLACENGIEVEKNSDSTDKPWWYKCVS